VWIFKTGVEVSWIFKFWRFICHQSMDKKKAKFRVRVSELNLGFKYNMVLSFGFVLFKFSLVLAFVFRVWCFFSPFFSFYTSFCIFY
jgi:hypothetical protein